jgi:general nucleoside transport system permease protein
MFQDFVFSAIRISAPLILAAMGGALTFKAGILNIALDGFMIIAAFSAIFVAYISHSLLLGVAAGVGCSMLLAGLLVLFNLRFRAQIFIAGIAITFIANGLTALLLEGVFHQQGLFTSSDIPTFPTISIPVIESIPFFGAIVSGHTLLVYVAYLSVPIVSWVLFRTSWGMRLRVIGEAEEAAAAAGVRVDRMKVQSMLASGFFCGLAGAYLSLGYVSMFAKQMTNDRGLIAIAAVIFAKGNPYWTAGIAIIFGTASALSIRLPDVTGFAPQLLQLIPYLITVLALVAVGLRNLRARNKRASWSF